MEEDTEDTGADTADTGEDTAEAMAVDMDMMMDTATVEGDMEVDTVEATEVVTKGDMATAGTSQRRVTPRLSPSTARCTRTKRRRS